ncbi:trypsin epsilon [Lepeophtheirus salmonis]|uniref:trypsin epsilon n=1 Tax=Lepeophtheirus salmonis TaxID=72036 RepID=UPI001AE5B85E|nr:trypsin epsilon-like [Lepeophtheirus salmonis]
MWSLLVLVITLSFSNFVYSFSTVWYQSCGLSPLKQNRGCTPNSNRIINGVAAEEGEIPWQVAIVFEFKSITVNSVCGGSIIGTYYVLSAAHCFDGITVDGVKHDKDLELSSVYAGGNLEMQSGKEYKIRKVLVHPAFARVYRGIINDIAIVTMKEEFEFSSTVQVICLPLFNSSIPNIGSTVVASGWGITSSNGTSCTPNLMRTDLEVYSFNSPSCQTYLLPYAPKNSIMCVHNPVSCTCLGDSGGPITMEVDGICTLVGVTSQGYQCGELGFSSLYMNVSHFLDWITDNISESCSKPINK